MPYNTLFPVPSGGLGLAGLGDLSPQYRALATQMLPQHSGTRLLMAGSAGIGSVAAPGQAVVASVPGPSRPIVAVPQVTPRAKPEVNSVIIQSRAYRDTDIALPVSGVTLSSGEGSYLAELQSGPTRERSDQLFSSSACMHVNLRLSQNPCWVRAPWQAAARHLVMHAGQTFLLNSEWGGTQRGTLRT